MAKEKYTIWKHADKDTPEGKCCLWCSNRLSELGIMWSSSGRIAVKDPVDDLVKEVNKNHLKSLVRRDYIEAHGYFPGLSRIIEDLIENAINWSKNNRGIGKTLTISGKIQT